MSGGTWIRTGDTMIFSHMRRPLGMRKTRIPKRIFVHGVPLDTTRFCPYCCATVDTAFATLIGTGSGMRTSACLTRLLGYSHPPPSFGGVSECNHKETYAGCIIFLTILTDSLFSASRSVSTRSLA